MVKLSDLARKNLPSSKFALPGERKYPIDTRARAANAKSRAATNATPSQRAEIDAKANRVLYGTSSAPKGRVGGKKRGRG